MSPGLPLTNYLCWTSTTSTSTKEALKTGRRGEEKSSQNDHEKLKKPLMY